MRNALRRSYTHTVIFIATLVGLVVLVTLPVITYMRVQKYHSRIEDEIGPATILVSDALATADEARSFAMSYRLGMPEPVPAGFSSPQDYYADLLHDWREITGTDEIIRTADLPAYQSWSAGKAEVGAWLERDGSTLVNGWPLRISATERENARFPAGIKMIHIARTRIREVQQRLRDDIVEVDRRQLLITAPLALVCILLAGFSLHTFAEIRRSEERLHVSIRETNHRVKNDLQVVSALLDMRMNEAGSLVNREDLENIVGQVRAMSAVHDLLSHEGTGMATSDALLQGLAAQVGRSAGLEVEIEADAVPLNTQQAVAVGLITNELLLNAGKHGAKKSILSFTAGSGLATLQVRDNGKGFPPGFDANRDANIGLDLVQTLAAHDLKGRVEFANDHGAHIKVEFPLNGVE